MQIIFDRSGGIMGLKSSLTINLDELPLDQAEALSRLVDEAHFFTLTENPPTRPNPDGFQYAITVESDTLTRIIRISDTSVPDELRPLLQELSQRAHLRRKS